MKKALIGYSGFVGSNLIDKTNFEYLFNSKNIEEIVKEEYDLLVCSGIKAVKWYANSNPDEDLQDIENLIKILKNVKTKYFVLISTIDIYDNPIDVNENTEPNIDKQDPYGKNRYYMETWVKNNFKNYLIIRLPALFGKNLKKNFIYDLSNKTPAMIIQKQWKIMENTWAYKDYSLIKDYYIYDKKDSYILNRDKLAKDKNIIETIFDKYNFTSLNFTDCRSKFQFYNLENLWNDLELAITKGIKVLNIAVEPVSAKELAKNCFDLQFENIISTKEPLNYNMKTLYTNEKKGGYLYSKSEIFDEIKKFKDKGE